MLAKQWKCDRCDMSVSRIDGKPAPMPETWTSSEDGRYCLTCRRERAATQALESAPGDTTLEARARLRRSALIEFEVRRNPDHTNGVIARACRSSAAAVADVRGKLDIPEPAVLPRHGD